MKTNAKQLLTDKRKGAPTKIKIEFSKPSKMPGLSYGLPAAMCGVGGKLRDVEGSVCSKCYAMKGLYAMSQRQADKAGRLNLPWRNFAAVNSSGWREAFIRALRAKIARGAEPYFRWHDQGDIQSVAHLADIVAIAKALPAVSFWLPTHEYGMVAEFIRDGGHFPSNLTVRVSAAMVDQPAPDIAGLPTSTVASSPEGATCPAPEQGGYCLKCRACWNSEVSNVAYKKH